MNSAIHVEIVGVNLKTSARSNDLIPMIGSLAWLQDTAADDVRGKWGAGYRDVKILDTLNRPVGFLNLTSHDMSVPGNYSTIRELFLAAAKKADVDADGLWDDWEMFHFQNLKQGPLDDPDKDGVDNLTELAFGTNPMDVKSRPATLFGVQKKLGVAYFNERFRRPAGELFDYTMETSEDLQTWSKTALSDWLPNPGSRVLFDGSGVAESTFVMSRPMSEADRRFVRVRAILR